MDKLNLPGPKAKEIVKEDKKYISSSYTRPYPAVIQKGKGVHVWDVDGNKFLDFSTGIAVCSTGHCHPFFYGYWNFASFEELKLFGLRDHTKDNCYLKRFFKT